MNKLFNKLLIVLALLGSGVALAEHEYRHDFDGSINAFYREDPSLRDFLAHSYAYVLYPKVGKGAFFIGGAGGDGTVYLRQGESFTPVARSRLTQVTLGLQFGGQVYSELVVFEDARTFEHFKKEKLELSANASGVVVTAGGAAAAAYHNGVAIFVGGPKGLMAELSFGGQKLSYEP